jgi:16S rRNA (uracil1498-N3)-methyltransferase
VFFPAERSEHPPRISEKWRRWAIESCKQCGRLWLPEFSLAPGLEAALAGTWSALLIATADEAPVPLRSAVQGDCVALIVGPEGDFTPAERSLALACQAHPISLGAATFRAEVAATLAAALIRYEFGALGP